MIMMMMMMKKVVTDLRQWVGLLNLHGNSLRYLNSCLS